MRLSHKTAHEKGRAVRREGELLEEIEAAKPGPNNSVRSTTPNSGRFAAGAEAGLSRHQTVTALRLANIPAAEFELAIEGDHPPTVSDGVGTRSNGGRRRPFWIASRTTGFLDR